MVLYTGPSNTNRWFPRKYDTILFYTKPDIWGFSSDAIRDVYKDKNQTFRKALAKPDKSDGVSDVYEKEQREKDNSLLNYLI